MSSVSLTGHARTDPLRSDGHALSVCDGTLRSWDVETGTELRQFEGPESSVDSVAVFHDETNRKEAYALFRHKLRSIQVGITGVAFGSPNDE
jgi:WD40 repeat protein